MNARNFIRRYLSPAFFCASVALVLMSLMVNRAPHDTDKVAAQVSARLQKQLDRLDGYGDRLMYEPSEEGDWSSLEDFPDHMVIYKYVCDTLQSWYNLFSVRNDDISPRQLYQTISPNNTGLASPLGSITENPAYVNLGSRWYVVKARSEGKVKLVEGIVVKDSYLTLRNLKIPPEYVAGTLADDGGSPVRIDGAEVFKILADSNASIESSQTTAVYLRIAAIILLTLGLMIQLYFHRSSRNCIVSVTSIIGILLLTRLWESRLTDIGTVFSPLLYAHDGILDSFATLMMFNTGIFVTALCLFWCREQIAADLEKRSINARKGVMAMIVTVIFMVVIYSLHTLSGLIVNSSINLELYKVLSLSHLTTVVYVSYTLLAVSLMLRIEVLLRIASIGRARNFTMLKRSIMLPFAIICAAAISVVVTEEGFKKETDRVIAWGNRMAVDRDLGMELQLRRFERRISRDPVLQDMVHASSSALLVRHRIEDMYLANILQNYNLAVNIVTDPAELVILRNMLSDASPIGQQSNFLYLNSPLYNTRYWGLFTYYDSSRGYSTLVVELAPKLSSSITYGNPNGAALRSSNVPLPPFYSYAKYTEQRLSAFSGNYPYPTVIQGLITPEYANVQTFVKQGQRHFVNHVTDDETIVISRRERGLRIYLVSFSFIALVIYMFCCLFRPVNLWTRKRESMYFSTRMRRLVVISLMLTMMLMASVSVIFVYQRNSRHLSDTMSGRISAVQVMMDGACRNMQHSFDMTDEAFVKEVSAIAYNTDSDITIYTPDGKFFYTTSKDSRELQGNASRISPDAFTGIILDHQRYYIRREHGNSEVSHTMFCPVFNAMGEVMCIVAVPYSNKDYDFIRDTVFHTATILSVFIILLFVTVLLVSSITTGIFRPLTEMSRKMAGADADALEQISYDGHDEISALVASYNTMVVDLKESSNRLAAAERDKAWSEMARQVAHEIKNPLTPIKLEIQRLMRLKQKNDPSWESKFDNVAAVVLEHIEILSQTANEFSTFAKLYTEEPTQMYLDSILKDQVMLFNEGVDITYLGMRDAVIMGPRPQTIRVFVNLLSNAVQATAGSADPKVMVSLRKSLSMEGWDIVIEDNGPGVSEENVSKLFTPNFTTKSGGTGLGLAICRSIVDRMGGTITYSRSFALGGACFTVSLPVRDY